MNWFDIVVFVCLGAGLIKGLLDGFIRQLIALIALYLAFVFSGAVAALIREFVETHWHLQAGNPVPLNTIYYIIAFVVIIFVTNIIARFAEKIINFTPIGILNKLAGGLFGVLLWLLCISFALNLLSAFDAESKIISEETRNESITYDTVKNALPLVYPYFKEFI
ncbi:MAG: CvpA family protein [Dysgonamonadaceae bacterium]|jgi:membrane protein required for colicin V production|nr:CvpA family protein [Dysgonamonadaceae bacterium]